MDIVRFIVTYLDSCVPIDDYKLKIPGYSFVRADHLSNMKHGRDLIYFKSFLQRKLIDVKYLLECIHFKKKKFAEKFFSRSFSRSLSHSKDEFETFLENFELNFDHIAQKTL